MTLTAKILYRARFSDALFIAGVYLLAIYIFDFLALSLLGTLFKKSDYASMVADEYSYLRMIFLLLSKLALSLASILFLRYCDKCEIVQFNRWSWLFLGVMILYYLVNGTLLQSDMNALLSWLMLLALIVLGAYVSLQHFIARTQKERVQLEIERARMKAENYERFMEDYRRNQTFYHDLKNHYLIVKAHLANKEYERAEAYLDSLKLLPNTEPIRKRTGIESLDILIAYKKNEAERKGICVTMITEPTPLKLSETESVALFGNLLDNAIEACENMEKGDKWIVFTIRKIRQMQFIKVENTYEGETDEKGGKLQTKKGDKSIHGIGLKSVTSIVEKYGGVIKTEYSEGQFSVIISIFD